LLEKALLKVIDIGYFVFSWDDGGIGLIRVQYESIWMVSFRVKKTLPRQGFKLLSYKN